MEIFPDDSFISDSFKLIIATLHYLDCGNVAVPSATGYLKETTHILGHNCYIFSSRPTLSLSFPPSSKTKAIDEANLSFFFTSSNGWTSLASPQASKSSTWTGTPVSIATGRVRIGDGHQDTHKETQA